eukprot:COSAG04_NODE_2362_length_4267_cov_3.208973_5_plen_424_part_00
MLSDAVPVVEADWGEGQGEEAARYFSFGPRGEQDFFDAADNAAIAQALANGDAAVRLPPKPFGTFEIRFGAGATSSRMTTPPKSGMLQVNLANQNSREVRKWDPELAQTTKVVTVSASAVHTANPASRLAAPTKGFPLEVSFTAQLAGGRVTAQLVGERVTCIDAAEREVYGIPEGAVGVVQQLCDEDGDPLVKFPEGEGYFPLSALRRQGDAVQPDASQSANRRTTIDVTPRMQVSEVKALVRAALPQREPYLSQANELVMLKNRQWVLVSEWVQVQAQGRLSRRHARVSDTKLAANMIVSLRKERSSCCFGQATFCGCFLACQPDDEPATVCFKWIFDLALLGALGFGVFFIFLMVLLSQASCMGRRVLLGAEDLQQASGWLVGQDIVRLEACGRPFLEGGQAMMAAAVEAADSDWWSAEL